MICITPCGARKLAHAAPARDLYQGPYFRVCLAYALSIVTQENTFILSAKHGLLHLTDIIEPYNIRFGQLGSVSIATLTAQAKGLGIDQKPALILGGDDYVRRARCVFPQHFVLTQFIGNQRGMGHQISWMSHHRGRLPIAITDRAA